MLPNEKTPEWAELIKKYSASTREQRNELAKEFSFKNRSTLQTSMAKRGIYLPPASHTPYPESQSSTPPPKPEPIILPIPKIELRPPPIQEEKEKDEEQVLLLSDTQFGLKTKSFGKNVAIKRMLRLYNATCRFADIQRKFCPVNKLNIFLIGDICHGELIGKQVMIDELELTLDEQKWLAYNELTNLIINACQWYSEIEITCVTGNHGILGKYFSYAANWNIVVYDMLKVGLTNYPQVKINVIRDDFYAIQKIKNTKFLILHGDKIPMYLSLPFYGIDRRSLRWNQSLPPWDVLCLASDTKIWLPTGQSRLIKNIKVGDSVIGNNGQIVRVQETFQRYYKGQIYEIEVNGLPHTIRLTPEHPVLTKRERIQWMPISQIKVGDSLCGVHFKKTKDDSRFNIDFCRLLGLYLAEGHVDKKRLQVSWAFNSKESSLIEETENLLTKLYNKRATQRKIGETCVNVLVCSKEITAIFNTFGGRLSENKRLSPAFLKLPLEKQKAILLGWLDGDGYKTKYQFIGDTISSILARQMFLIALRLGWHPVLYERHRKDKRISYEVRISMRYLGIPQTRNKKLKRNWHRVRNIHVSEYEGYVFNLRTSKENPTYNADGLAVHNCMGHFHSLSYIQPSGIPIMINGTMSSDSRFVAQWLGIKEIAEMWTFFVQEKYGITGWHKIDLMREEG